MRRNFSLKGISIKEPRVVMRVVHRRAAGGQPGGGDHCVQALRWIGRRSAQRAAEPGSATDAVADARSVSRRLADKVKTARDQGDQFLAKYIMDRRTAFEMVLVELNHTATEAGIKPGTASFNTELVEGSDTLEMMSISQGFEGTYANLTKFVNLLDKSPRFLVIENMQASAPQGQGGKLITVTFKIDTFVKDQPGEAG